MNQNIKPRFEGEPLVPSPNFAQLRNNAFGGEIVAKVNEKYKGTAAEIPQSDIRGKDEPIVGSNYYRLFAIDAEARAFGARVALPEQQEILLAQNRLPEQGSVYYDRGVILAFSGENHGSALKLYDTLPAELKDFDRFPAVMLALDLARGNNDLDFRYGANSQLRTSKILKSQSGNFNADDFELLRSGLPSKVGEGTRYLGIVGQGKPSLEKLGLHGFFLCRNSYLSASSGYLTDSNGSGRVVLSADEVSGLKNLDAYASSIEQARKDAIAVAKQIADSAIARLRAFR